MDARAFRANFPVLENLVYLNAGTDGPIPRVAADAAARELAAEVAEGRVYSHFERRRQLLTDLRAAYASVVGCDEGEVALTTSTSEGCGAILGGLSLGPGDEIVTSDSEHPGLIGPLLAARARGVTVKAVPFRDLADAVSATTTLVACSHVNWHTGELAPAARARAPPPRWPTCRCRSCSTARRASARSASTCGRWVAPRMRRVARSGCAVPTARGCSTSRRSCSSRCSRPGPATRPSRTPRAGWTRRSPPRPASSTPSRSRVRG